MKAALAIYDMDRTITRRATYTPFLIHAASRLAPWRLVLLPLVPLSMLAYGLKLVGPARLKEINYRPLLGGATDPTRLAPVIQSFPYPPVATNILPHARAHITPHRDAHPHLPMSPPPLPPPTRPIPPHP